MLFFPHFVVDTAFSDATLVLLVPLPYGFKKSLVPTYSHILHAILVAYLMYPTLLLRYLTFRIRYFLLYEMTQGSIFFTGPRTLLYSLCIFFSECLFSSTFTSFAYLYAKSLRLAFVNLNQQFSQDIYYNFFLVQLVSLKIFSLYLFQDIFIISFYLFPTNSTCLYLHHILFLVLISLYFK